jgi:hypothetical protein
MSPADVEATGWQNVAAPACAKLRPQRIRTCRIGRARSGGIWPASADRSSRSIDGIPVRRRSPRPVRCTDRRSARARSMYDITLSDGACPRERAPTRRYGRQPGHQPGRRGTRLNGRSARAVARGGRPGQVASQCSPARLIDLGWSRAAAHVGRRSLVGTIDDTQRGST